MILGRIFALVTTAMLATTGAAVAQQYPTQNVHIVVGNAPGGNTDIWARLLAQGLSDRWHQTVVVDNKPGANNTLAAGIVARAPADGYTILASAGDFLIPPDVMDIGFDPLTSFAPVSLIGTVPTLLVVGPKVGVNSLKELIALAKAKPGQLHFASAGTQSAQYIQMKTLMTQADITLDHVIYNGTGPALLAMQGNEIQTMFASVSASIGMIQGGQIKALAVSTKGRVAAAPDIPSVAEAAGLPNYDEKGSWAGVFLPAKTPPAIISKLHDDIIAAVESPEIMKRLDSFNYVMIKSSPAELGTFAKAQYDKIVQLNKDSK